MEEQNEESKNNILELKESEEKSTAEQLIPDPIGKRKKSIMNLFTGWIKDDYDKLFLIIVLIALIIRILVYLKTNDQAIWWDAADYLASAKRWGLGMDTIDLWYRRRGFLWPLISSLFFRIGLGELSIRVLLVSMSTGIIFVTYFLISEIFNKRLALLTSIGVTFSWVFLFFTGRPLTNLPATFFLLLAFLFFWKAYMNNKGTKYFILFGIFYALACLTRMQYLMFAIIFLLMAIVKEKFAFIKNKKLWYSILVFLIVFIPQLLMYNAFFGNPILDIATYYLGIEGLSQSGEIGGVVTSTFSNYFVYFTNLPYILDGDQRGYSTLFILTPIYILFVIGFFLFFIDLFLGFDKIFENKELQKKFFMFIMIIIGLLSLGYIAPHLEQRYAMPLIPFLFFIAIYPLYLLASFIRKKYNFNTRTLIIISSVILIIALVPNYQSGFNLIESKKASYIEIKQAGEWIKANSNPEDIIVGGSLPQLTYYSERTVYPFHLAYRRDLPRFNESDFDKFILENRPIYFMISGYEKDMPWAFAYPSKHSDLLIPVQAFGQQERPILVIYRFDYNNQAAVDRLKA